MPTVTWTLLPSIKDHLAEPPEGESMRVPAGCWGLKGPAVVLVPGARVVATRSDGWASEVVVGEVISTSGKSAVASIVPRSPEEDRADRDARKAWIKAGGRNKLAREQAALKTAKQDSARASLLKTMDVFRFVFGRMPEISAALNDLAGAVPTMGVRELRSTERDLIDLAEARVPGALQRARKEVVRWAIPAEA